MNARNRRPTEDASMSSHVVISTTERKRQVIKRTIAKMMHALPTSPVAYIYYDPAANYAT